MTRRVVIEADGGSRGNPGPAAYGAVLRDADTGEVIAEDGTAIGVATNNVAEYSGLLAGLRMAAEHVPGAEVEVRMDSQLVVEQMSGRWRIKHPDLQPLAAEAADLAPRGTTYTWIPREQNRHADRLVNEALDGRRSGVTLAAPEGGTEPDGEAESEAESAADLASAATPAPARGWSVPAGPPTTLVVVRHGATSHTPGKRFSGGLASANPGLSDDGRAQVVATAEWLAPLRDRVETVVASPVRRTRESAEIVAELLGAEIVEEHGLAEMEYGAWDGLTAAEVRERFPGELETWLGDLDHAPGGGESFRTVQRRVDAALDRLLERHRGQTVVVVSHVTPIKILVAHALDVGLDAVFRMELAPASVTVLSFYDDGDDGSRRGSMRLFNAQPTFVG